MFRFANFRFTTLTLAFIATTSLSNAAESDQQTPSTATAILAGGCFWCLEADYDKVNGVLQTTSGYAGGKIKNPTYEQVSSGTTGHIESVQIEYDPNVISYRELIDIFWEKVDPTDAGGQFCDRGRQYRTAIFPNDKQQKEAAESSLTTLQKSGKLNIPIATEIILDATFYPAETYHQNYYNKNPIRYKFYRYRCGRDERLEELWGKQPTSM